MIVRRYILFFTHEVKQINQLFFSSLYHLMPLVQRIIIFNYKARYRVRLYTIKGYMMKQWRENNASIVHERRMIGDETNYKNEIFAVSLKYIYIYIANRLCVASGKIMDFNSSHSLLRSFALLSFF